MKKLFLIGNSPLPDDESEYRSAAGIRTFQFLEAAKRSRKYSIKSVVIELGKTTKNSDDSIIRVGKDDVSKIQKICDDFSPDLILGVNTFPSYIACRLRTNAPIWADLNGWVMAEAESQADKIKSDALIPHYFTFEKSIFSRADKFSAVSRPEMYALLGSLAWSGRLNSKNFGKQLVYHIPNGTEDFETDKTDSQSNFINITKDTFNLLWLGGYNTWVDEEMLFAGVNKAMKTCTQLRFISTGGAIPGLDNETFKKFQKKVESSEQKDQYKFLGWVKTNEIPQIYSVAHVGLNIDKLCTETLTGARNRINEMMKFGLPVITTPGSEIAGEAVSANAGIGVKDAAELSDAIIRLYKQWGDEKSASGKHKSHSGVIETMGANGRKYIMEKCNFSTVCKPFLEWEGEKSAKGIHLDEGKSMVSLAKMKAGLTYLKRNGLMATLKNIARKARLS